MKTVPVPAEFRLIIYRKALEFFHEGNVIYLCDCINTAERSLSLDNFVDEEYRVPQSYPEFRIHRTAANVAWWPVNDRNIRIAVLENCIREVQALIEHKSI